MINAELISKIKAEIDRLYDGEAPKHDQQCNFDDGYFLGIDVIAQFLDSLESENYIIPDGLDEEVHRFFEECIEVHEVPLYGKVKEDVITADCYEITARHFAKWGAEHAKK